MATREEKIKKINDELEKLRDEELDQVAGGSWLTDPWESCKKEVSSQQNVFQNNNQNNSVTNHSLF